MKTLMQSLLDLLWPVHRAITRYMARVGALCFANVQGVATSFKTELLNGIHALGTTVARGGTGADVFKAALFLVTGSRGAATTAYSATDEVSGAGYTAGGAAFTWIAPSATGTIAFSTPSASIAWTGVTLATAFDALLLYNSTQGNKAVSVHTFGSQTLTAGNFTLTMPANDSSTALLKLA